MAIMSAVQWSEWKAALSALLVSNRVCVNGYRYTRPAPTAYEHLWLWDSGFHAIGYRWIDPEMARDELLSVTSHQFVEGPDSGMIPHMVYHRGGGKELWLHDDRSTITQLPVLAFAAHRVFRVTRDRPLLETVYPRLAAFHDWFDRRRDPDGDGLVCLIHPWEDWDSSPRWDRGMKLPSRFPPAEGTAARKALAKVLPDYGHDPTALAKAGYFMVEPVEFNAIRAADLEAMAEIADELGKPSEAESWRARARAVQRAVQTKMMEPLPRDLEGLDERPIEAESASHFIALFGGCATREQAERLVERMTRPDYWTEYPIPSSPVTSPTFAPDEYWRGNTWIPVNYLIYLGLRRYGYAELATRLAEKTVAMVSSHGIFEFYHPITGEGLGAKNQSWTALMLDMIAEENAVLLVDAETKPLSQANHR